MHFSRQEYWSGLPCPPPGHLPNPCREPRSPALQADSLPSEPPRKPPQGSGSDKIHVPIKALSSKREKGILSLSFILNRSAGFQDSEFLSLESNKAGASQFWNVPLLSGLTPPASQQLISAFQRGVLANTWFIVTLGSAAQLSHHWSDFFFFIYFYYWRLITLQHCSGFCHILK